MKKILLATDLGSNSDRAMERAITLANETGAKLHIIHATPAYAHPAKKKATIALKQNAEELIRFYLDGYKSTSGLDISITVMQGGDAFAHILDYAYKIKADLIVMGMHGKAKFRDLFVGTTLERVVRKGGKPVLMVKNKVAGPYKNVLAGIDFAPGSRSALRMAMEFAPKATFCVVHSYDIPHYAKTSYVYSMSKAIVEERCQKDLKAFLKTETAYFKKEHGGMPVKLKGKLVVGSVYDSLVRQASAVKADVIAIGAHEHFGYVLPSSKLGGVAEDILANPPCDVLIAGDQ